MKTISTLVLSISSILIIYSCSESKTKAQQEVQKEVAVEKLAASVITDKHVKIPNSSLYIIPPDGFALNETIENLGKGEEYANFIYMKIISGYTPEKFFSELKT